MTPDLGSHAPKYHRVADELRRQIREGDMRPGDRLPAETELRSRHRVSLPTIRQALALLRAEGLIESRQGIGTFVKENRRLQRRSRDRYRRARHDRKLLTAHLRHEIEFAGRAAAPEHIAQAMDIEPGAELVVRRRRLFDRESGKPEEVGASYLPVSIAAGTLLEKPAVVPKALFLCVEELTGTRYARGRDQWVARMPSAEEAAALELPPGAPVLHVIHTAYADDDTVLEVAESVWPADRVLVIEDYPIEPHPDLPSAPSDI